MRTDNNVYKSSTCLPENFLRTFIRGINGKKTIIFHQVYFCIGFYQQKNEL